MDNRSKSEDKYESWIDHLGIKKSPFYIDANEYIVGLDDVKREMLDWITSGNISMLYGDWGSGKTSIVLNLIHRLEKMGYRCMYLEGKSLSGEKIDFNNLYYRRRSLFNKIGIKKDKVVVFLDEFSYFEQEFKNKIEGAFNERSLRNKMQRTPVYSVVCIQIDEEPEATGTFKSRLGDRKISTRTLTEDECLELVKYRYANQNISSFLDDDSLKLIINEAERIPRVFLELCERITKFYAFKKDLLENPITKKEVILILPQIKVSLKPEEKELKRKESIIPDSIKASPLQKEILEQLYIKPKTNKRLSDNLSRGVGTITKQLSLLRKKGYVVVVKESNPKVYGLDLKFKRRFIDKK